MSKERAVKWLTDTQLEACLAVAKGSAPHSSDGYGCLLVNPSRSSKLSLQAKGYVQIKVDGHANPNKKVQLHQLVAWQHPDLARRLELRAAIRDGLQEISHLCKQKRCMTP